MRAVPVLLCGLAAACGDEHFGPGRSVRLLFEVTGLPNSGSAQYRVFVQDSVEIAHGLVANGESDTVRISSESPLRVRWEDALLLIGEASFIYRPEEGEVLIEESDTDTSILLAGSYALASGGFILNTPGVPVQLWAHWLVRNQDDSVVAGGPLRAGEVVRRGDLPPGSLRLQLDTIQVEQGGIFHDYAPPLRFVPLSISPSLDLVTVNAPFAVASVAVRMSPSGLPAGTHAPWVLGSPSPTFGSSSSTLTDTVWTFDRLPPNSYTIDWGEVTVNGTTYRPDPATQTVAMEPRLEPYEFATSYTAVP